MGRHLLVPPLLPSALKSTTNLSSSYQLIFAANPDLSLIGGNTGNSWYASSVTGQRLHFDLMAPAVVTGLYYENAHNNGGGASESNNGLQNFTFWGSNADSDFSTLTYASDGTWQQLATSPTVFAKHVDADATDPRFIEVSNSVFAFRYYAVKAADNWGGAYMGIRRLILLGHANAPVPALPMRGPRMR